MAISDSTTKTCPKCKTEYPATTEYFARDKKAKDGLYSQCKVCNREYREAHKEYQQNYRAANKEKLQQYYAEWQQTNREYNLARKRKYAQKRYANDPEYVERRKIYSKHYRARYPDKMRAAIQQWRRYNPERYRSTKRKYRSSVKGKASNHASSHRYRARQRLVETAPFDEQAQLKRQKSRCYYCGCKLEKYHIEHVVPLSRGGSDRPENKVLSCPECNLKKSDKAPHEWDHGGQLHLL